MALNVNSSTYYALKGIDANSVNAVKSNILNTGKVQNIDYSKFNRINQGLDFYSNRTDITLQRQIAVAQAGLYVNAINVAPLNSNAAVNLYNRSKVGVSENTQDKNSNSSNGFNPFKSKDEEAKN